MLDELLARFNALPAKEQKAVAAMAAAATKDMAWIPNPGPQLEAFNCPADELFYGGQAGGGKALSLDTPIPTPAGWSTMGQLACGDVVFDESGHQCRVVALSPVMFGRPCFRVAFSDGSSVLADADHRWFTLTASERDAKLRAAPEWRKRRRDTRPKRGQGKRPDLARANASRVSEPRSFGGVRTTAEIAASLYDGERANHSIDVADAIECEPATLPIDPYLLGAWLGDGASSAARMTIAEPEVAALVAGAAAVNDWTVRQGASKYDYGVNGGFKVALRELGLLGAKAIPDIYLRASVAQRLALLQGLMDTDGYADTRGQCEFTTTSRTLAQGTEELILSLGIKVSISEGRATLNGRDCGPKYRLKFVTELPAFRLRRKLERQKRSGFRPTVCRRYITDVMSVPSVPVKCIAVDSPSRLYLCGRQMIPTHNTDLGIGLALTAHKRSLIIRRINKDALKIVPRIEEVLGHRDGYNGQLQRWRLGERQIDIAGCEQEADKQRFKGDPHDLIVFDEGTDLLESQYRFIIGWNRSTDPAQRCRVLVTSNPPTTAQGLWVIKYWAPWLDPTHPNPAKPGELRWYTTINGEDCEVDGPGPHVVPGEKEPVMARSRTYIPASLADNPDLKRTNYAAVLAGLPEELRRAYKDGDFTAGLKDAEWQLIPTAWIEAAMQRWVDKPPAGVAMTAQALDCAGGGTDSAVLASRYGGWYAPLDAWSGPETADPFAVFGRIATRRRDNCPVVIDMGGGYGGGVAAALTQNGVVVARFNGASASAAKAQNTKLGFVNKRAEVYWRFREELDPNQDGGSPIALPPDPELKADLAAPRWENTTRGIKIESKEDIRKRLGRSPDKGDAVVMCLTEGTYAAARAARRSYASPGDRQGGVPKVTLGYAHMKGRH